VKKQSTTLKKIGNALNTDDDKGIIIAVAIALLIVAGVVAGYYVLYHPTPEGYTEIYVLDANGQAVDYPDTLSVNQNYTFNVWVENHMGETQSFEVQLKITNESISLFPAEIAPINTYTKTLANGETWETQVTVTLHEIGNHSIIFELWQNDAGTLEFTGNAVILNVEAVKS
jgi:uncharacterized membrane protein